MVRAFPRAGGRPSPHGAGMISTRPPAPSMARIAPCEKAWARTVSAFGELAPAEDLDQAALGHEAVRAEHAGVDHRCRRRELSSVSRLTTTYSTRNGFLKPLAFGVRRWIGVWPPSNRGATLSRAPWPLVPRPAVLPPLPAMPRPTRRRAVFEPGRRLQIMDLHQLTSSTSTRCGTRATMPRISGRSGSSTVWLIRRRPSARMVPRCFGLVPIVERTWVMRSVAMIT